MVKTAAGNSWSGKEVVALLLDRRGDQVKITDEVVKTAIRNYSSSKEVIILLLINLRTSVPPSLRGSYNIEPDDFTETTQHLQLAE